jgi:hypothetical protein
MHRFGSRTQVVALGRMTGSTSRRRPAWEHPEAGGPSRRARERRRRDQLFSKQFGREKRVRRPDRQDGAQAPPEAQQARLSACASTSSWSRSAHAPQPPSPYSVGLSWRVLKRQPHPDDLGRCCYLQLHHRLHPTARARFLSATRCSRSGYLHLLASPSTRSHHSSTPASWAACAARVRWQAQLWRVSGAATRTWSLGATHRRIPSANLPAPCPFCAHPVSGLRSASCRVQPRVEVVQLPLAHDDLARGRRGRLGGRARARRVHASDGRRRLVRAHRRAVWRRAHRRGHGVLRLSAARRPRRAAALLTLPLTLPLPLTLGLTLSLNLTLT